MFHSLYQWTPLHTAAKQGQQNMVEYLIGKEASINIKDNDGVSACRLVLLIEITSGNFISYHWQNGNQYKPFSPLENSLSCGSWRRPFGYSEIFPWKGSGYQHQRVVWCKCIWVHCWKSRGQVSLQITRILFMSFMAVIDALCCM